jgi:hypothetical protein
MSVMIAPVRSRSRNRHWFLIGALVCALLGALAAWLGWLILGHASGWSRGDEIAVIGVVVAVGAGIGGPFAGALFERWFAWEASLGPAVPTGTALEAWRTYLQAAVNDRRVEAGSQLDQMIGRGGELPQRAMDQPSRPGQGVGRSWLLGRLRARGRIVAWSV